MTDCPTPDKKRYATYEAADNAAHRSRIAVGPLYPYTCACTWIHLSKTPTDTIPADAIPNPIDVQRLQLQSDTTFRDTVATEASGKSPLADRIALRHPGLLKRWHRHLNILRDDAKQQLKARAHDTSLEAHDWRRRAEGYLESLIRRTNECRDLQAHVLTDTATTKAAQKEAGLAQHHRQERVHAANQTRREARNAQLDQQLDQYGIPRLEQKDLRRQAGEAAIQRLIDAHGIEFSAYLAEECARLGAELPPRVRKHLSTHTQEHAA